MEQIFVFSDVHANRLALSTIWARVFKDVTASWFLGDGLGLGPWPLETLDLLREILGDPNEMPENVWLAGNHDWALIRRGIGGSYEAFGTIVRDKLSDYSEDAIDKHRELLNDGEPEFLEDLKTMPIASIAPFAHTYVSHGGFTTSDVLDDQVAMLWEYIKVPGNAEAHIYSNLYPTVNDQPQAAHLHMCGHWHVQSLWRRPITTPESTPSPVGHEWQRVTWQHDEWVSLEPGYFYHLNPGSVGFPSDRDSGRPSYALVEWDEQPRRVKLMQIECSAYSAADVRRVLNERKYDERIGNKRLMNCFDG